MNDKSQLNGNAATLALAEALSGVIKEAVAPLDAKVEALEAKVDAFAQGQNLLLEMMGEMQAHLDERIDRGNLKVQAHIADLSEAWGPKPAGAQRP